MKREYKRKQLKEKVEYNLDWSLNYINDVRNKRTVKSMLAALNTLELHTKHLQLIAEDITKYHQTGEEY